MKHIFAEIIKPENPKFIKGIYCMLIKNNKVKDIKAEFGELEALYDNGYIVEYNLRQVFIKNHIYADGALSTRLAKNRAGNA